MRLSLAVAATAFAASSTVSAIDTITAKGSKFFTSSGAQFFIKGVAYQLTPDDPLADGPQCSLDAKLMQTLGANTVRVYHVDPTADHSSCMSTFSDAGIYAFIDLDTFTTQITATSPTWNETQVSAFQAVIDEFQKYDNVAGFFVGNEVLTVSGDSIAAPYVKAAARDMKAYRDSKGYRSIPIGYSAADVASLRPNLQNYLACGANTSESVDFFSLNAYEWCGASTYAESGYSMLEANASSYNVPIFFSETGCNTPQPRTFADQAAIFGSEMDSTWSGAIVYEWIMETNNYGLVSYGPSVAATATGAGIYNGFTRSGTPTPISPDFDNLSSQWATATPSSVSESAYVPSNSPPACPAYTSGQWNVNGNVALPSIGQVFDAAVSHAFTAGHGTATTSSSSTATSKSAAAANMIAGGAVGSRIFGMALGLVCVMLGFICWL